MGTINIQGSNLGNALQSILMSEDIIPGDQPSYELCKTIWIAHPLGKKMVEGPISMAQSQPREISVPDSPEDFVRDKFVKQWEEDRCDETIYNMVAVSRAYGISTLALVTEAVPPNEPIPPAKLPDLTIAFSVFDPLNTAGSLVLNQNPSSIDFMKVTAVSVSGQTYHRSRTVTLMNEHPVYIAYTTSAFGFVGRSVFQRALFPLKSFVQSMVTDDLVTKKAGVFIAMLKTAGAIIDKIMQASAALKRLFVHQATNGNVISIGVDEKIETLNMQNIDGAFGMARKDILENIATAADMPAIILKQETFAEGFGEGTEDAKLVAGYVAAFRRHMQPVYKFLDPIIQRRAWTPEFFQVVQNKFPSYREMRFEDAFYAWSNSFAAAWPNLLTEPDSEKIKVDDVKLKAIIATVEVFGPKLDPENFATLVQWAQDNINENKLMFQSPLVIDVDLLAQKLEEQKERMEALTAGAGEEDEQNLEPGMKSPAEPKPFAAQDSARSVPGLARSLMRRLDDGELRDLVDIMAKNPQGIPRGDAEPNGDAAPRGPKRDRAAYMRNWRARQRQPERVDA